MELCILRFCDSRVDWREPQAFMTAGTMCAPSLQSQRGSGLADPYISQEKLKNPHIRIKNPDFRMVTGF